MLVGENGTGKSTLVEAIAVAFGFNAEGGGRGASHVTRADDSELSQWLWAQHGVGTTRCGFFLRSETMHSHFTYLEQLDRSLSEDADVPLHELSHGESFLELLDTRFSRPGFYCLDEPEAALSFSSTLHLISTLHRIVADGGQVVCATHSPVLASMPGAHILEVGPWGLREQAWEDLELVDHWKRYLDAPGRYLRHLID